MNYKGYTITTKKEGKRYLATGIKGAYRESSFDESEEDSIRQLKNKIDMSEAFVKGDALMKKYTFDRPFVATLEGKEITIYSLDFIQKVFTNDLKLNYEFVFKTDNEEIFSYFKGNIKRNRPMTFKVYPNLEILVYMDFKFASEIKEIDKKIFKTKCNVISAELIRF